LIKRKCEHEQYQLFRNAFLIVSGHGLKLWTKKDSFTAVKEGYMAHLRKCFHTQEALMPAKECWLDIGQEDTPEACDGIALTLLQKATCAGAWTNKFRAIDQRSNLTRRQWYPWCLTRDVGSITLEVLPTNRLHSQGGVAYNKAYNLHKDIFATPMKGVIPFNLNQLEGLGFDQDLLNRWYELSHRGGQTSNLQKRKHLLDVYQQVKRRLYIALQDTYETCFGVRQEYRINLFRLKRLDMRAGASDHRSCHRPYMVLETEEVNDFIEADVNRWLLCLEALICQVEQGPVGLSPISAQHQMTNGVMVSAIVRTLQANLGAKRYLQERSLWSKAWTVKRRTRQQQGDDGEDHDSEVDGIERLGLDYDQCHLRHGLALLPAKLIDWENLPVFSPHIVSQLGIAKNGFGRHLRHGHNLHHELHAEHDVMELYRRQLQGTRALPIDSLSENGHLAVLKLGAELVIRSYLREILNIMKGRECGMEAHDVIGERLSDLESDGFMGFTYVMMEKLFHHPPHVIIAKRSARRGISILGQYDMQTWHGRLSALFSWDDQQSESAKARGWEHSPFRVLSRRLAYLIGEELGQMAKQQFLPLLITHAASKLWLIPQFDLDKLSVLRKASEHHAASTQTAMKELTFWQRTNWIMPQLPNHLFGVLQRLENGWDNDTKIDRRDMDRWDEIKTSLEEPQQLMVRCEGNSTGGSEGLVKNPHRYGQDLRLHLAIIFWNELGP
jgi:hypothetical protein